MSNTLPQDRGAQTPSRYFLRLLVGLVQQHGGELRIKADAIEAIDKGWFLVKTWDAAQQEVVLHAHPPQHTEVYVVESEASAWTVESRPHLEEAKLPARAAVLTDEAAAKAEERRAQKRALREVEKSEGVPPTEAQSTRLPFYVGEEPRPRQE